MRNIGFMNTIEDVKLLTNLMGAAIDRIEDELASGREKIDREYKDFYKLKKTLANTKGTVDSMCFGEWSCRNDIARKAVEHVKTSLEQIKDPHYHRMEKRYVRSCGRGMYLCKNDTPNTIRIRLSDAIARFDDLVDDLNHAFVPAPVSGIVGAVAKQYRKKPYIEIVKARDEIISLAEELISFQDVINDQKNCNLVFNERLDKEKQLRDLRIKEIPDKVQSEIAKVYESFDKGYIALKEGTSIFDEMPGLIEIGKCWFSNPKVAYLAETAMAEDGRIDMQLNKIGFPVKTEAINENLLFIYENDGLTPFFATLATDILCSNDHTEICLIDTSGLGSSYRRLKDVGEHGKIRVLNSEEAVGEELNALEKWITDTYDNYLQDRFESLGEYNQRNQVKRNSKYLILDNLISSLESRYYEQFIRIMKNGVKAGVYVICSVENSNYGNSTQINEFLSKVRTFSSQLFVRNNRIKVNEYTYLLLRTTIDRQRRSSAGEVINVEPTDRQAEIPCTDGEGI